jgi:phosphatidate cytidylyltransferase
VIAVAKFCDVGALLTGLAIGRHKMAPITSPKKTWEGAVGGVIVATGVGALVAWLGRGVLPLAMTPLRGAVLAAPVAAIAIVSDLVESVIKRRAAIKDSGGGIPGIGGIFDLSDSLILAAPLAYFLLGLP